MMLGSAAARRRRVYEILEGDDQRDVIGRVFHFGIIGLIILTVFLAILDTVPSIQERWTHSASRIGLVSTTIFFVEYLLRIWVCVEDPRRAGMTHLRARVTYMLSFDGIIDLVAVLPFFIVALTGVDLRTVTLLRLLRFFKLLRYSTGIMSLFEAIYAERHTLFASLVVLLTVVVVAATVMYEVEGAVQPAQFGSIPLSMWWAMETITTVGYGDVIPVTAGGRVIAAATMVLGLIVLALPVAIVATSFNEVIRRRGFLLNWATLSRLPLFSGLDTGTMAEVLSVARAHSYDSGNHVLRRGDDALSLYVIALGEVEVETESGGVPLKDGDCFGGPASFGGEKSDVIVRALNRTRIVVIPDRDLAALMARRPVLAARVRSLAKPGQYRPDLTGAGGEE